MSKLLKRAMVNKVNADTDYSRILDDDAFLDICCFHLQQSIELVLKYLIEVHDGSYAKTHDIRAQLNVLNRMGIKIPKEKELRQMAGMLNAWEAESRYLDSFVACLADIEEAMGVADVLLDYANSITKRGLTKADSF